MGGRRQSLEGTALKMDLVLESQVRQGNEKEGGADSRTQQPPEDPEYKVENAQIKKRKENAQIIEVNSIQLFKIFYFLNYESMIMHVQEIWKIQNKVTYSSTMWVSFSVMFDSVTLWTEAAKLLCPWNSPGKNTGMYCHSLLQGIFLTQGSNPGLLHCRQILYHLSHQGSTSSTTYYNYFFQLFLSR